MEPNQVFTPRRPDPNETMYIHRDELQEALVKALKGSRNVLIHGQSGCGKSWLYKHTLKELKIPYLVANMANARRLSGLNQELENVVNRTGLVEKKGYEEEKKAAAKVVVVEAGVSHKGKFEIGQMEPYERCLHLLFQQSRGGQACLVFENFEQILDHPGLIRDVADCIILLDDERYASYNVKLVIIGVPSHLDQYFAGQPNVNTIINRLCEIPEVSRLEIAEAEDLVERGLVNELGFGIENRQITLSDILYVTDRIPQSLHELCLEIALNAQKQRTTLITRRLTANSVLNWLHASHTADLAILESLILSGNSTDAQTRLLFIIGRSTDDLIEFDDIQLSFESWFGKDHEDNLFIRECFNNLVNKNVLREMPGKRAFRLVRPQYRMCLRVMLRVDDHKDVHKTERNEAFPWQAFSDPD